jgi:hypothetical protein
MASLYARVMSHFFAPERYHGQGFVLRSYNADDGALLRTLRMSLTSTCGRG